MMLSDVQIQLEHSKSQNEYLQNKLSKQKDEMGVLEKSNIDLKNTLSTTQDELISLKSGTLAESANAVTGDYKIIFQVGACYAIATECITRGGRQM
jgi:hypothetical protein